MTDSQTDRGKGVTSRLLWLGAVVLVTAAGLAVAIWQRMEPLPGPPQRIWWCRMVGASTTEPGAVDGRLFCFSEMTNGGDLTNPATPSRIALQECWPFSRLLFVSRRSEFWVYHCTGEAVTDDDGEVWLSAEFVRTQGTAHLPPPNTPPR